MTLSSTPWRPGYPVDRRGAPLIRRAAAGPYGDTEYRAARIVARATGARVVLQDDNAQDRTPDMRIGYSDGRRGVGEVVTVTDPQRAAESREFANGGLDLFGEKLNWKWWVTAPARVDRRGIQRSLVEILEQMELANERPPILSPIDPESASFLESKLLALGVTAVSGTNQSGESRGQVCWQPEGVEGETDADVEGFQNWLVDFLAKPLARGKADKMTAVHGDIERHLVVGVSWSAPWPVVRLLDFDVADLPTQPPALPTGIGHLWLWGCESPSGRALAWWPDRGWFDVARRWATE